MELLYLYFSSPEVRVNEQDLNFGGKYRFKYNTEFKELIVSKNPFYIESFFSSKISNEAIVSNVTSIIGENGAGKSSLLRLIRTSLAEGHGGIRYPLITAFEYEGKIKVYHFNEIKIDKHNLDYYAIELHKIDFDKKPIIKKPTKPEHYLKINPKIPQFAFADFIYFSNIFDGEVQFEVQGGYDISTNFLVRNDYINNVENNLVNRETNQRQIEIHIHDDIERQIKFINRYKKEKFIPFELPEYILITTKKDIEFDFEYSRHDKEILQDYRIYDEFLELLDEIKKHINIGDAGKRLANYFIASSLINFLIELAMFYRSITQYVQFKINSQLIKNNKTLQSLAISILDDIEKQSNQKDKYIMPVGHIEWIHGVKNFIKDLPDLLVKENTYNEPKMLYIKITNNSRVSFERFYDLYIRSYRMRPYLNFKWRDLSTGEKALLNIYARFYSLSNEQQINKLKKNVIIIIDEGDAYLHPAWQKKFVNLLLDFLPKIYAKTEHDIQRNIQILLTTNSPIPTSDLPNDNTIFLKLERVYSPEKGDYITKTVVTDSLNEQKETFAANIYTLLSDSFFIEDGLIGDFATKKIDEIINELTKGKKPNAERREEIRNIIYQIGEPILKHKLMQMYNDRFNLEIHERLDKIEKKLGI